MTLDSIALPPNNNENLNRLVVILHGWGADAHDLLALASSLNLQDCKYLFPNAPYPHPQVPGGRAWYGLETKDFRGLSESRQRLLDWILDLEAQTNIPLSRTALCGFSQGGAMVLDVGLELPVAAIVSLSGFLHTQPKQSNKPFPPIFMAHGQQDMVVPIEAAEQAKAMLDTIGADIQYQVFDMGHEIKPAVISSLEPFLAEKLA